MIATPTCPLTSPYTSRSSLISAPSGTPGNPSGGGVAYSGSSRTLGSPCINAFSPSANVPSRVVDAGICSVMLMDDSSGVGQLRSVSWISGSLKPCTHHRAFALYPVSVSFQRRVMMMMMMTRHQDGVQQQTANLKLRTHFQIKHEPQADP